MQLKRKNNLEFITLKKSHKKEIVIGALVVFGVLGALTFNLTKAKYQVDGNIDLVKGTVNYKPYDFKIMAMYKSDDGSNYVEIEDRMPTSGYVINEEKSYCTLDNKNKDTNAILKTIDENHVISNLAKSDKCYLYFDKIKGQTSSSIIANLGSSLKSGTPTFTNAATSDEGVYSVSDGMYSGTSYYWRGASTNNYVKFANFCWRIIRINGDGSIRLIYDGTTCHANGSNSGSIAVTSQAYNPSYDRSEYVGWNYSTGSQRITSGSASNIKSQTDTWYNNNIGNNTTYSSKVADGKFCNDRETASGYGWSSQPSSTFYYAGYDRSGAKSASSVSPTLSCTNASDVYTLKAGAITMDEVIMAGAKWGTGNSNYYLYNGQYYWTMSPYYFYWDGSNRFAGVFYVRNDGRLNYANVNWTTPSVRPVINLKADTLFKENGTGTQNNPYEAQ